MVPVLIARFASQTISDGVTCSAATSCMASPRVVVFASLWHVTAFSDS